MKMKITSSSLLLAYTGAVAVVSVSAFSPVVTQTTLSSSSTKLYQFATTNQRGLVEITDIYSPRDVYSMDEWATQYGMQKADGVELYSEDGGNDYGLISQSGISAGQSVVYVPSSIVLNSASIQNELGQSLTNAESAVMQIDAAVGEAQYRLPLLRLMVKILIEYEKGMESPFYPWLNSLPREFYNGKYVYINLVYPFCTVNSFGHLMISYTHDMLTTHLL